jgi:uncharacterized membrane protein
MGCCGPSDPKKSQDAEKHLSPADLLKIRLAKGEISFEEYEKTKAVLAN